MGTYIRSCLVVFKFQDQTSYTLGEQEGITKGCNYRIIVSIYVAKLMYVVILHS